MRKHQHRDPQASRGGVLRSLAACVYLLMRAISRDEVMGRCRRFMALSAVLHLGMLLVTLIVVVAGRAFLPAWFAAHHSLRFFIAIAVVAAYVGMGRVVEPHLKRSEIEQRASEIATPVGATAGALFMLWTVVMPFGAVLLLR